MIKYRDKGSVRTELRQRKGVLDSKLAARKPRNIVTLMTASSRLGVEMLCLGMGICLHTRVVGRLE